jgi:collagen type VII alpha
MAEIVTASVQANSEIITATLTSGSEQMTASINVAARGTTGSTGSTGATGATGVGYSGINSTSNITIGTGVKTFTLTGGNAGAFITGQRIRAIHSDTPTFWIEGYANYIGGGTLIITSDLTAGSGTHNNWNFAIAGQVGATGETGATGATGPQGPAGPVSSVAGRTGEVTLVTADITDATTYVPFLAAASNTFTGLASFTSTTRPTSSGTGTPAGTSLITRDDFYTEQLFSRPLARSYPIYGLVQGTGSAVGLTTDFQTLQNAAINGSSSYGLFSRTWTHAPGGTGSNNLVNQQVMFSHTGVIDISNAFCAVRFLVGVATGSAPNSDANALTGRGVGWEVYYSATNSRNEIRILTHNGTTYTAGTGVAFPCANARFSHIVLEILGTGTVNLYGSNSAADNGSSGVCPRPSSTPITTSAVGPSGANRYSGQYCTLSCVTTTTGTAGVSMIKLQDSMIKFS